MRRVIGWGQSEARPRHQRGGQTCGTTAHPITTVPLTQVAPLKNNLTNGRVDVQYFIRANVAIGATYLYERYIVDDFALGAQTLNALAPANASNGTFASAVYSGYLYQDYKANTGWFRVTFLW